MFHRCSGIRRCSGIQRARATAGTCLALCLLIFQSARVASAQAPRVLPLGELPADSRLQPLKDLNGYFPFKPPSTLEAWEARRALVKSQLLVATGLWPMPKATPLNPVVHGKVDLGDYTVERVYFESMPGFYVTGSLYRPTESRGKTAGILCPHGHWENGRFYDCGEEEVERQIGIDAEAFPEGGRSPLQSRCVQLARMGAVVFHYDMIGYADSQQISHDVAHRFTKQRSEMNQESRWGLFSPQAESHLQSVMGLQTYNSIRALDFLETLPDVDPNRLAVTGASGGGTQTFMLAALDSRIKTAFPAVMVSTAMQGGCTCENSSLLRIDTGNVEIAALFAPKPLGVTAANDWTKEMETKGFPQLKAVYQLYDAAEKVSLTSRVEFGHNYNQVGRDAMYHIFQPVLGLASNFDEKDYRRLSKEEMTVWDADHPAPLAGEEFERDLLEWWHRETQNQLEQLIPDNQGALKDYRAVLDDGVRAVVGREFPESGETLWELVEKVDRGDSLQMTGWIRNVEHDETLPVVFLYPKVWNGKVVIWLDGRGKNGLYDEDGKPKAAVARLVSAGVAVVGADLLMQGEFLKESENAGKTRRVANPREAAAYTFGYNHSLAAQRVHDVLTLAGMIARDESHEVEFLAILGTHGAGAALATAAPLISEHVDLIGVDTEGFRYGNVKDLHDPSFLPGGARYFDLPGFISLATQSRLVLAGEGETLPRPIGQCFKAAGKLQSIECVSEENLVSEFSSTVIEQ
ncbi:MAG: acetylxylan esterase [Pirellulaceae bacterium]|nr:acetylxylan esterase [Pirellulaceae bacterium]